MKVTGKITKVLDTQKGTSAAGKEWQKLSFILETTEDYNNLYCFDVFGDEKVEQFLKFNTHVWRAARPSVQGTLRIARNAA